MPASLRVHASRATVSRPYDRHSATPSPAQSETAHLPQSAPPPSPVQTTDLDAAADVPPDRPGLPTYAEYKRIEAAYLHSLSPRKRDKALITQAMFDKIWDVLHQPEACTTDTPQFRFWVRKMFTLSRHVGGADGRSDWSGGEMGTGTGANPAEDSNDLELSIGGSAADAFEFTEVVLHENRPVAITEQLYELFCYCHVRSGHGGRDKTCAVIREHYSWVPKELTAQFVKACPTCVVKRSGYAGGGAIGADVGTVAQRRALGNGRKKGRAALLEAEAEEMSFPMASPGPGWPTTGGPLDPGNPEPCGVRERERKRVRAREDVERVTPPSPVTPAPTEVPLRLDGCPMGGCNTVPCALTVLTASPFHTCEATRSLGRPVSARGVREDKENHSPIETQIPSPASVLSNESFDEYVNLAGPEPGDAVDCLFPPALRPLRLLGPLQPDAGSDLAGPGPLPPPSHPPFQIDPVLLSFNYPGLGLSSEFDAVSLGLRDDVLSHTYGGIDRGVSDHGLYRLGSPSDVSNNFKSTLCPPRDSPGLSFEGEVPCTTAEGAAAMSPLSLSTELLTPSRCGFRYGYRDGPFAMLYPCSADEVGQEFDGPLSFSIMTDV